MQGPGCLLSFFHEEAAGVVERKAMEDSGADVSRPRSRLKRIIAGRGYDSDALRSRFRRRRTELIVPYRKYIRNRRFEDKRKLRRNRKRWKIERTNAWLQNFRRIQLRYDRILTVFQGSFHCACLIIALGHLCNEFWGLCVPLFHISCVGMPDDWYQRDFQCN
jgi:transposase